MKKGTTVEQQLEAAKILNDLGILLYGSLIVEPDFSREDFRELAEFVRRLDLRYATFSVLTPFPGTLLHAEREKDMISRKHELYDLLHVLLPTKLPLQEFYAEFSRLYEEALPLRHRLAILGRYGFPRILSLLLHFPKVMAALRNGHQDYESAA